MRTHAQKYQQKLEREQAKRKNDMRMSGNSVGAAAAAAVAAAARVAIHGDVPGAMADAMAQSNAEAATIRTGPTSSSSGKDYIHPDGEDEGDGGGMSMDGSSSTNELCGTDGLNENESNCNGNDGTHREVAAAAVAAEAANLGGGMLDSRQAEPVMVAVSGCNGAKTNEEGGKTEKNIKNEGFKEGKKRERDKGGGIREENGSEREKSGEKEELKAATTSTSNRATSRMTEKTTMDSNEGEMNGKDDSDTVGGVRKDEGDEGIGGKEDAIRDEAKGDEDGDEKEGEVERRKNGEREKGREELEKKKRGIESDGEAEQGRMKREKKA